jgi:hypothetical protein
MPSRRRLYPRGVKYFWTVLLPLAAAIRALLSLKRARASILFAETGIHLEPAAGKVSVSPAGQSSRQAKRAGRQAEASSTPTEVQRAAEMAGATRWPHCLCSSPGVPDLQPYLLQAECCLLVRMVVPAAGSASDQVSEPILRQLSVDGCRSLNQERGQICCHLITAN